MILKRSLAIIKKFTENFDTIKNPSTFEKNLTLLTLDHSFYSTDNQRENLYIYFSKMHTVRLMTHGMRDCPENSRITPLVQSDVKSK